MLQLYVLLQRTLRPVDPITEISLTVVLALDFFGSPPRSFQVLSPRRDLALIDLFLDLLVSSNPVQSHELTLNDQKLTSKWLILVAMASLALACLCISVHSL
jgi:hypothetical protein